MPPGASVLPVALPDHQVDEEGDEGDGAQRQNHHQGGRGVGERHALLGAVVEVGGVSVEEVVLHRGVGAVAAQQEAQLLQADRQAVVGPTASVTRGHQRHSLKHYSIHWNIIPFIETF